MTICIGPFCIPTYAIVPIFYFLAQLAWDYYKKNFLGKEELHIKSRVIGITSKVQWQDLITDSKSSKHTLVVDFTATWCGPCRSIKPYFHELSNKYANAKFVTVDVDQQKDIARECGVSAMPTFHFYKSGEKCDEVRGADRKTLQDKVEKHCA